MLYSRTITNSVYTTSCNVHTIGTNNTQFTFLDKWNYSQKHTLIITIPPHVYISKLVQLKMFIKRDVVNYPLT